MKSRRRLNNNKNLQQRLLLVLVLLLTIVPTPVLNHLLNNPKMLENLVLVSGQ